MTLVLFFRCLEKYTFVVASYIYEDIHIYISCVPIQRIYTYGCFSFEIEIHVIKSDFLSKEKEEGFFNESQVSNLVFCTTEKIQCFFFRYKERSCRSVSWWS